MKTISGDDEDEGDVELIGESVEMSNPPSNPDRPSLKVKEQFDRGKNHQVDSIEFRRCSVEWNLNRKRRGTSPMNSLRSFIDQFSGQTEWFAASEPVPVDENLELLCSGTFGGDNA